jgi:cell division septation protein DedD
LAKFDFAGEPEKQRPADDTPNVKRTAAQPRQASPASQIASQKPEANASAAPVVKQHAAASPGEVEARAMQAAAPAATPAGPASSIVKTDEAVPDATGAVAPPSAETQQPAGPAHPVQVPKRKTKKKGPLILLIFLLLIVAAALTAWQLGWIKWPPRKAKIQTASAGTPVDTTHRRDTSATKPSTAVTQQAQREWSYYVQAGSFTTQPAASAYCNELRRKAISARVENERLNNGTNTNRVLVGPFATEEEAKSKKDSLIGRQIIPAEAQIQSYRISPTENPDQKFLQVEPHLPVRRKAAGTTFRASDERTMPSRGFVVIAGSFSSPKGAREIRDRLVAKSLPAFISRRVIDQRTWFSVVVGPFSSRKGAANYVELIRNAGVGSCYIFETGK